MGVLDAMGNGIFIADLIVGGKAQICNKIAVQLGLYALSQDYPVISALTDFGINITMAMVENSKLGLAGAAIASAKAICETAKLTTKVFYIGDCHPRIIYAEKGEGVKEIDVAYTVDGYKEGKYPMACELMYFKKSRSAEPEYTADSRRFTGSDLYKTFSVSYSGTYGVFTRIYPVMFEDHPYLFRFYGLTSSTEYVTIPLCNVKSVTEEHSSLKDNTVQIQFKVVLEFPSESDRVVARYGDDYGIAVYQRGKQEKYSMKSEGDVLYVTLNFDPDDFEQQEDGRMVYMYDDVYFYSYYPALGADEYGEGVTTDIYYSSELCPDGDHVHAIDLGLSVKWACCNVGATSPEKQGNYYAWGETGTKNAFYDLNYEHFEKSHYKDGTVGITFEYTPIGGNISGTQYDAARSNCGSSWRIPTIAEWEELYSNCTYKHTTIKEKSGVLFTSKVNGHSIFLPQAGVYSGWDTSSFSSDGGYWTSERYIPKEGWSWVAYYIDMERTFECISVSSGLLIRPVTE